MKPIYYFETNEETEKREKLVKKDDEFTHHNRVRMWASRTSNSNQPATQSLTVGNCGRSSTSEGDPETLVRSAHRATGKWWYPPHSTAHGGIASYDPDHDTKHKGNDTITQSLARLWGIDPPHSTKHRKRASILKEKCVSRVTLKFYFREVTMYLKVMTSTTVDKQLKENLFDQYNILWHFVFHGLLIITNPKRIK